MTVPRRLWWALGVAGLVAACRAPEAFYHSLSGVPQPNPLATTAYAVGDTLTISGKLGGAGAAVTVTIGGVNAPIVAHWDSSGLNTPGNPDGVEYNVSVDYVSVVIDSAMGLGPNRPVTVAVNGLSASVGSIYINGTPPLLARSDTLVFTDTAANWGQNLNGTVGMPIRGDVGDGKVYWIAGGTLYMSQIGGGPAGRTALITNWADQSGTFVVAGDAGTPNTLGGRDPSGRYIYASVITDSAPTDTLVTFRLLKIDLTNLTVTTLNRSTWPTNPSDITPSYLASLVPTGALGTVFLPALSQIYPAADGTIYFVNDGITGFLFSPPFTSIIESAGCLGSNFNSAVGKIDVAGNVTYLVKSTCGLIVGFQGEAEIDLLASLNKTVSWNWIDVIDPDQGIVYASGSGTSPTGQPVLAGDAKIAYNLNTGAVIGTLAPPAPGGFGAPATEVSGPFAAVNGVFFTMGVVPGGGHRVWVLSTFTNALPTLLEIADFDQQYISPYVEVQGAPAPDDASGNIFQSFSWYAEYIVNHTAAGVDPRGQDPIIATQGAFSSPILYATVDATSASSAVQRVTHVLGHGSSVAKHPSTGPLRIH